MAKPNSNQNTKGQKGSGSNKSSNNKPRNNKPRREQPRKDSSSKRINEDNARVDKVEQAIEEGKLKPGSNDISDFNKNPDLLQSACRYPFASILGTPFPSTGYAVPGVLTYVWQPNFSNGKEADIFNKAYQQIYSYVVHKNSRNYKYEYTDLAMYITAGSEVFSAISDAVRAYGVLKLYPEPNRYLADGVLQALGWYGYDLRNNMNQMYFDILNLIQQSKNLWIPNTIPLLTRWIKRNASIYTDAPGMRSQMYAYVRDSYLMLSETASSNGTCLVPALITDMDSGSSDFVGPFKRTNYLTPITGFTGYTRQYFKGTKWKDFYNMVQNMINQLVASQDRGMIYGDILNAYGDANIYAFPSLSLDYAVIPEYNAEILMQMENITITNACQVVGLAQLSANIPNRIVQVWAQKKTDDANTWYGAPTIQLLNIHTATQPSPENVMLMTRCKSGPLRTTPGVYSVISNTVTGSALNWYAEDSSIASGNYGEGTFQPSVGEALVPSTAGTELVSAAFITRWNNVGVPIGSFTTTECNQYAPTVMQNTNYNPKTYNLLSDEWWNVQAFDWHIFFYRMVVTAGTNDKAIWSFVDTHGDFDNYTTIDESMLREMNDVALYSVLEVPHI